jgi:hypothetical protein
MQSRLSIKSLPLIAVPVLPEVLGGQCRWFLYGFHDKVPVQIGNSKTKAQMGSGHSFPLYGLIADDNTPLAKVLPQIHIRQKA